MFQQRPLQKKLLQMPAWFICVYAAVSSFAVYCCMYAFRKPFTAAGFKGVIFLNIDYKVWLVTAQLLGYMLSKFYGIKFISAINKDKRAVYIVRLILVSWLALLLFAVIPAPFNIIFLFMNGFPLGMVWGLVFSYLEGRKATEFMGAVLSVSFIFSSGFVKTIGKSILLNWHYNEMWMPFITGSLFVLPMILFTWLLNQIPPPTKEDIALRSARNPMTKEERKIFLATFLPGIVTIVSTYVLLTILRDFRDNFANELWTELGFQNDPVIFSQTEIPISLIVLLSMSLLIYIKNNIKAFIVNHYIIMVGYVLAFISTLLFASHLINPVLWMTIVGTGLYLSYVPFNALYFERMIASYKIKGNVGFIMYVSDSFGYLGSAAVLFFKEFLAIKLSWTNFFINAVFFISVCGITGTVVALIYFLKKYQPVHLPVTNIYAT